MKELKTLEEVKEYVRQEIESTREAIKELACGYDPEVAEVTTAEVKDLPKFVSVTGSAKEILTSRLKGAEPDMQPYMDVLSATDFDEDEERGSGEYDGSLRTLIGLANALGMTNESERAYEALYSE